MKNRTRSWLVAAGVVINALVWIFVDTDWTIPFMKYVKGFLMGITLFYMGSVSTCPGCGRASLPVLHLGREPLKCKKCGKTIDYR